jgi:hypothetical protein
MSGPEARVRGSPFEIDDVGTEPGLKCRLLLESDSLRPEAWKVVSWPCTAH